MTDAHSTRRLVAKALVVAIAGIGGLLLAAEPVAAATTSATQSIQFTPFGGSSEITCTITISAQFPAGGANSGKATTTTSGSDPACTTGVETTTAAEYRSTNGDFITEPYTWSYGPTHSHTYTSVKNSFQTYHQVYYAACSCTTQVYTLSTPDPK